MTLHDMRDVFPAKKDRTLQCTEVRYHTHTYTYARHQYFLYPALFDARTGPTFGKRF